MPTAADLPGGWPESVGTNLPMRTTGFMRYDPATFTDYPSGNVYSVPTELIPLPRARPNGLGVENSGPPTSITDNPDGTLRLQFAPDDQGFWNQLTTDAFGRILSSITRNQSNAVAQQTIFTDGHGAKQTVYNVGNDNLWSQRQILYSGSADAVVADIRDYTNLHFQLLANHTLPQNLWQVDEAIATSISAGYASARTHGGTIEQPAPNPIAFERGVDIFSLGSFDIDPAYQGNWHRSGSMRAARPRGELRHQRMVLPQRKLVVGRRRALLGADQPVRQIVRRDRFLRTGHSRSRRQRREHRAAHGFERVLQRRRRCRAGAHRRPGRGRRRDARACSNLQRPGANLERGSLAFVAQRGTAARSGQGSCRATTAGRTASSTAGAVRAVRF